MSSLFCSMAGEIYIEFKGLDGDIRSPLCRTIISGVIFLQASQLSLLTFKSLWLCLDSNSILLGDTLLLLSVLLGDDYIFIIYLIMLCLFNLKSFSTTLFLVSIKAFIQPKTGSIFYMEIASAYALAQPIAWASTCLISMPGTGVI